MPSESTFAVDNVSNMFLIFSFVTLAGITAVTIYFIIRYNRKRNPRATDIRGNIWLEITWMVVPTLIGMAMFYYGLTSFSYITKDVPGAMTVKVEAFQFGWQFEYANGAKSDQLKVPLDKDILLLITSRDVIHSFYAPAFRIKTDAVPGMTTKLRFKPTEAGSYDVLCAEYCGLAHSGMLSSVVVVPQDEFASWYEKAGAAVAKK
jgi:cytochrome c oxidase subunit II